MNNQKLFEELLDSINSNTQAGTLGNRSFQSLLKSAINLAYTNGYCDAQLNKEMDNSL